MAAAPNAAYAVMKHGVNAVTGNLVAGLDGDAGLLEDFPPHRVARVLVQLHDPAGQDPIPLSARLMASILPSPRITAAPALTE